MADNNEIKVKFNIFQTGRDISHKERGYVLDNVREVIDSPQVQERVKKRQLFGYYGHTMRELAGKMSLGAKNVLKLSNGQEIVADAVPACVCSELSIDDEGNVTHTQEILKTPEGDTIKALHTSKVGGFSWAASGGAKGKNTFLSDLFGFDYVPNPRNLNNNGFGLVLDSDEQDSVPSREKIIKILKDAKVDKPGTVLDSWYASETCEVARLDRELDDARFNLLHSNNKVEELSQQILDAEEEGNQALQEVKRKLKFAQDEVARLGSVNDELKREKISSEKSILDAHEEESKAALSEQQETQATARADYFREIAEQSHIHFPKQILDSLITGENTDEVGVFFNSIAKIDTSKLPLGDRKQEFVMSRAFEDENGEDFEKLPEMGM